MNIVAAKAVASTGQRRRNTEITAQMSNSEAGGATIAGSEAREEALEIDASARAGLFTQWLIERGMTRPDG